MSGNAIPDSPNQKDTDDGSKGGLSKPLSPAGSAAVRSEAEGEYAADSNSRRDSLSAGK